MLSYKERLNYYYYFMIFIIYIMTDTLLSVTVVTVDNLHQTIVDYINDNKCEISSLDDMKDLILSMLKSGFLFNMDLDRLRDCIEQISYHCNPNDVVNKDRVLKSLEYDDTDDEDFSKDYLQQVQEHIKTETKPCCTHE